MNPTLLVLQNQTEQFVTTFINDYKLNIYKNLDKIAHATTLELNTSKETFLNLPNPTEEEEIFYFKKVKIPLLSVIQFCAYIRLIEQKKPGIKFKKLKNYYLQQLEIIKTKTEKMELYYSYWFSENTNQDHKFFIRAKANSYLYFSGNVYEIDHKTNTQHIPIFAKVIALSYLNEYIKQKIKSFSNQEEKKSPPNIEKLKWTSSKADLIELIYALHTSGLFNNGKADLKEIAEYFQHTFEIDLGQYNRVFYDIRARKTNKTKYLDTIKMTLLNKIKDTDNELFI